METKHTPGPWFAEKAIGDFYYITDRSLPGGIPVATTWRGRRGPAFGRVPQEANARLIAAAPDLLEALISAAASLAEQIEEREKAPFAILGYTRRVLAIADAAIAGATGDA